MAMSKTEFDRRRSELEKSFVIGDTTATARAILFLAEVIHRRGKDDSDVELDEAALQSEALGADSEEDLTRTLDEKDFERLQKKS